MSLLKLKHKINLKEQFYIRIKFALVALRSDGSVVYYDRSNPPLGVITPICQPPSVQFVGVTTSGFFTIGRNTTLCPTATPTRTVPPTRTTAPRFTMTPVASATSTQTATRIASATSVPVATATATRTATAKPGKPSATKVMTKTPTKSPTKSRTPTKAGKPTKTPTKRSSPQGRRCRDAAAVFWFMTVLP